MERLKIIHTVKADLPFVHWLFEQAILYQKKNGYPAWKEYDTVLLEQEIEESRQYKIVIDEQIACIFSTCFSDEHVWGELEKGDAVYLHRVIVNPNFKGRKLFGEIVAFVKERVVTPQIQTIRMDTWGNNPVLRAYYQSFGFKIIGYRTTPDIPEVPIQQRGNYVVLLELTL